MREIKFRGKSTVEVFDGGDTPDINLGDWIYGNLIIDKNEAYIVNGVVECTSEYISIEKWCPVDITTVGQFTGLKDKNGVEVYHEDIIRPFDDERTYRVIWNKDYTRFDLKQIGGKHWPCDILLIPYSSEVIGNIYENPELLKKDTNEQT